MATEDGNSPYITPPTGFPFMGKLYDRVYVSSDAMIYNSTDYIKNIESRVSVLSNLEINIMIRML